MNLYSSKMFISVFLSAAPPRLFQTQPLEREVEVEPGLRASEPAGEIPSAVEGAPKDPRILLLFIRHQGVLTIPACSSARSIIMVFLSSAFATVKLFLKHHTSYTVGDQH